MPHFYDLVTSVARFFIDNLLCMWYNSLIKAKEESIMPFINVKTNTPIPADKAETIKAGLGQAITAGPG